MPTTVKVSDELARQLREIAPTMDGAIRNAISSVQMFENIPFSKSVASLQEAYQVWRIPFDGYITQIVASFPDGCNSLVYSRLIYIAPDSGTYRYIIPSKEGEYLHLNDSTPEFDLQKGVPVQKDGTLRVEWQNYDGSFSHTVAWSIQVISSLGASPR